MGYYLLDNKNPYGEHFHRTRYKPLRVIVLHITAGLEDKTPPDASAEQTARYAATTDRQVSWHAGADSDSYLYLLPAGYTAWHASNYNSLAYGIEISARDTVWSDEPREWVEATLRNTAAALKPIVEKYGIPLNLLSRADVDAGMSGFTYHMWLDPARRSDPGKDFPINKLFAYLGEKEEEEDMTPEQAEKLDYSVRIGIENQKRIGELRGIAVETQRRVTALNVLLDDEAKLTSLVKNSFASLPARDKATAKAAFVEALREVLAPPAEEPAAA